MWFTLVVPDSDATVDAADELDASFSRHGAIELLDELGAKHDWPYEVLENLSQDARDRFYREEAEPAAQVAGVLIAAAFGFDGASALRLGTAVPALVAYAVDGAFVGVHPHRSPDDGEARPIVGYLQQLLAGAP